MTDLVIVIPCYNEQDRLDVAALEQFELPGRWLTFLLVNDGSTDGTLGVLRGLAERHPQRFAVLDVQPNAGKAEAVRRGMLAALERGPGLVGFWDADLATPLWEIPAFLDILDQRPAVQMVFGARVKLLGRTVERRALRHYLGRCFATAASMALRLPIYDTQCGAKIFRVNDRIRAAFAEPFISRWIFDVELIARLEAQARDGGAQLREQIVEYPLQQWQDVAGSKVKGRDFLKAALELWRIKRRYLR